MKQLIFSTGNDTKFSMADAACSQFGIELVKHLLDIDEIQGEDSEKIVIDKAEKAYGITQEPVVVSDDTWSIPGLNGFPGSYMKSMNHWFAPEDFLHLTSDLEDRRILLVSYLAYKDENETKIFKQVREAILLQEAKGESGPASQKVISMAGDNGLSIAEVYDKHLDRSDRDVAKIWHELAEWYASR